MFVIHSLLPASTMLSQNIIIQVMGSLKFHSICVPSSSLFIRIDKHSLEMLSLHKWSITLAGGFTNFFSIEIPLNSLHDTPLYSERVKLFKIKWWKLIASYFSNAVSSIQRVTLFYVIENITSLFFYFLEILNDFLTFLEQ
jgi:hypothetical protein